MNDSAAEAELAAYLRSEFRESGVFLPLGDEVQTAAWAEYAAEAAERGAWTVLREKLPPLWFPIQPGQSQTSEYRQATRRGGPRPPAGIAAGVTLQAPETVSLRLHPTAAGRVPVIQVDCRPDFVNLVQALAHRNEPVEISPAQGACTIGGFINWDRLRRGQAEIYKDSSLPSGQPRDRFIILGPGPYSGIPAAAMKLSEAEWLRMSADLRLAHEAAHYFTRLCPVNLTL